MFKVEIDLWHAFTPPMEDRSKGIVLTRTIMLPFPPTSDIAVYGAEFDPSPGPLGMVLKDITWDSDRHVFLANSFASTDGPIGMIPHYLREWTDKGWRFGSSQDRYDQEPPRRRRELPPLAPPAFEDEEEMEAWHTMPPKKRPPEFNLLLKSLVREMAKAFDCESKAYAIDKTQLVFEDEVLEEDRKHFPTDRNPVMERFRKMQDDFLKMPQDKQFVWRDRVLRKYPHIKRFVDGC